MDNKINILGINLYNYFVKDSLLLIDEYLNSDCLNVVDIVQIPILIKASENSLLKEYFESMDFTVVGDEVILKAVGITEEDRTKEVKKNQFLEEFLEEVARKKKTVFLLCDRDDMLNSFHKYLIARHGELNIAGKLSIEKNKGEDDSIVNEINSVAPDVILAVLKTPFRQEFVICNRNKLSAKLWLGVGDDLAQCGLKGTGSRFLNMITRKIFKTKARKFNEEVSD